MNDDLKQQFWDALLVERDPDALDRLLTTHPRAVREMSLLAELIWSEETTDAELWSSEGGEVLMRLAEVLLRHGADMEDRRHEGLTPLMLAAKRGNSVAAEFLIQRGSILEARDDQGQNVLHFAADGRDLYMLRLCLDAGVAPNLSDASGRTPLHVLFDGSYPTDSALTALLLERGASANARDDAGRTALYLHASQPIYSWTEDDEAAVRLLLKAGGDPFAVADDLGTPWVVAAKGGNIVLLGILRWAAREIGGTILPISETDALDLIGRGGAGYFSVYADAPRSHPDQVCVYTWGYWFLTPAAFVDFETLEKALGWNAPKPNADYLRQHPIVAMLLTEKDFINEDVRRLLGPKLRLDAVLRGL